MKKTILMGSFVTFLMLFNIGFLSLSLTSVAYAIPTTVSFTADSFTSYNGTPGPADPVTGSFVYDALGDWSNGSPVLSVDLTIGSYAFTASEVNAGASNNLVIIGGTLNGTNVINSNTNDFWLVFDMFSNTPFDFHYSLAGINEIFKSYSFSEFSVTTAPVPEPGTMLLLGVAMAGFALHERKRRKTVKPKHVALVV